MAKHLDFRTDRHKKGDTILSAGSIVTDIGLVLSGSVRTEYTDLRGNKSILGIPPAGGVFAESYACIPNEPMMVDAAANEDCHILSISVPKLFTPCPVCGSQNDTGTAVFLFFTVDFFTKKQQNCNSVRPTATGRLSEPGPQRFVEGIRKNEE